MKYIFSGGGTLGHTNPAIAVAEAVRKKDNTADILFLMRKDGHENQAVINRGFKVQEISATGLKRELSLHVVKTGFTTLRSIFECTKIIKDFKPDRIFVTGGYVSFSPMLVGAFKKIPTFVHESNSSPGLVTKIAAKVGAKILLNYDSAKNELLERCDAEVVGNPLLPEFDTLTKAEARAKIHLNNDDIFILSFSGSGGAKKMNDTLVEVMNKYSQNTQKVKHAHISGNKYFDEINESFPQFVRGKNGCKIVPIIEKMATVIKASDIVICRCGSSTLSEIMRAGKAAILIPSPNVTDNHQYKNGLFFAKRGAAIMNEEKDLTADELIKEIKMLVAEKSKRTMLERKIKGLDKTDSADIIANMLIKR